VVWIFLRFSVTSVPSVVRSFRVKSKAVIALDLGGTKLATSLFAADGRPLGKRCVPLEPRIGSDVGELISGQILRLQRAAAKRGMRVAAVGICVPGIADPKSGCVWAPNLPGWEDYPLRTEIQAAVSDKNVKVVVESDRAASILGEAWQGAARGCRNAIFLAVGTGIGAGIMVDGRVLHGAHNIAGAIGWLALDRPFRPEYADCGCFESHASGEGLAKIAKELLGKRRNYRGPLRKKSQLTARDVFAALEKGDAVANEVMEQAIEFWGMASANLISLFNPEKIIFGGGVFGPATQFIGAIQREASRWAQPIAMQKVNLEASQLGSDAALYGAAYLALRSVRSLNFRSFKRRG
jgi:glucokinase